MRTYARTHGAFSFSFALRRDTRQVRLFIAEAYMRSWPTLRHFRYADARLRWRA